MSRLFLFLFLFLFSQCHFSPLLKNFQHILAFGFAIQEINANAELLPNITLGFRIQDNGLSASKTYWNILEMLFPGKTNLPNYSRGKEKKIMAVLGGLTSQHSVQMANILNVFKIPQLSYGPFDRRLSDKTQFPSSYQLMLSDKSLYIGVVHLLKHFRWTWVGFLVPDDTDEEMVLWNHLPMLTKNNICIAFQETIPEVFFSSRILDTFSKKLAQIYSSVLVTKVNVTLVYGHSEFLHILQIALGHNELYKKHYTEMVWIGTAQWDIVDNEESVPLEILNGTLSFTLHQTVVPGFQNFLHRINPYGYKMIFLNEFWQLVFNCSVPSSSQPRMSIPNCTGKEKLENLPGTMYEMQMSDQSYNIYNAVYIIAHVLHAMHSSRAQQKDMGDGGRWNHMNVQPWQLLTFLNNIRFNNSVGEEICFQNKKDQAVHYDIINWITYSNQSFRRIQVGKINVQAPEAKGFTINEDAIVWNPSFNQIRPNSTCVKSCYPGFYKVARQGEHICCYDCVLCPERMFSIQIDADYCQTCPEDQHPNKKQDRCIPKVITYLSYEEPLGTILASSAGFFTLITLIVMWSFIQHRNTPLIKANNWIISCLLLSCLLFSFLCSFLYIGKPGRVLCLLRQLVYNMVFSVTMSCILAKTMTVLWAFETTKPENRMKKWAGKRLAGCVVILGSLTQTVLHAVQLATSPAFPEFDMHSHPDQIILQCNRKSSVMLYIILGYLGFQAILCFIIAFLVRKLPDTFNEAKVITFSILLFFSLLVTFIPVHFSSKGKNTVALGVFSILSSNAGLLGFIFLPKFYIIVLRPELNVRGQVARKKRF